MCCLIYISLDCQALKEKVDSLMRAGKLFVVDQDALQVRTCRKTKKVRGTPCRTCITFALRGIHPLLHSAAMTVRGDQGQNPKHQGTIHAAGNGVAGKYCSYVLCTSFTGVDDVVFCYEVLPHDISGTVEHDRCISNVTIKSSRWIRNDPAHVVGDVNMNSLDLTLNNLMRMIHAVIHYGGGDVAVVSNLKADAHHFDVVFVKSFPMRLSVSYLAPRLVVVQKMNNAS